MKNKLCSIGMMSIVLFTVLMAGNKQQEAQNDAEMIEAVELINVAGLLGKEKGMEATASYNNEWRTFYLYRGKLVLLMEASAYDFEVPLPEIHEYLKVDPWYD